MTTKPSLTRHFTHYSGYIKNNQIFKEFYSQTIDIMKVELLKPYFYDQKIKNVYLYKIEESTEGYYVKQKIIKFRYKDSNLNIFFHISLNNHESMENYKYLYKWHVAIDQIIINNDDNEYKIIFTKENLLILQNNDIQNIFKVEHITNKIFEIFRFGLIHREGYLILKKYLPTNMVIGNIPKITNIINRIYSIIYNVSESFLNRVLIIYYKYTLNPSQRNESVLKQYYDKIKKESCYNEKYKILFQEEIHTYYHDNYKDLYETNDDVIFDHIIETKKKKKLMIIYIK